ncbi:MAG: hypothetical protein IRZ08_05355 [Frankia sp.]|nr:hypothetical protein [Frankia sp.]
MTDPPTPGSVPAADRLRGAVRGATPLAVAGLLANVANLGVTLVIAREMSTRSYGAMAQLFALFMVVSMPGSALQVGVVRRVTAWARTGQAWRVPDWAARVRRGGLRLVVVVALLALAARGAVARELSLPGPGGVAETITAGAAWCLLCVDRGLLQAGRHYSALAVSLLVDAAVKAVATVALVAAGLAQAGAAGAVLLGVLAALWHSRRALRRGALAGTPADLLAGSPYPAPPGGTPAGRGPVPRRAEVGTLYTFSGSPDGPGAAAAAVGRWASPVPAHDGAAAPATPATPPDVSSPAPPQRRLAVEVGAALTALAFLALLQNVDVLVQGRLSPDESGQYAAVSVTCKVLIYAAIVLAGFLLPEAADRRHLGEHALHQLGATLAILAVPAAALLGAAVIAPETLLSLAFGPRFTEASGALLPLAGAMTCLGATVLFTHYLLALGSRAVLAALGATAVAAAGLIAWAGGSPAATAQMNLAVQAVLAVVTGLLVVSAARRTAGAA